MIPAFKKGENSLKTIEEENETEQTNVSCGVLSYIVELAKTHGYLLALTSDLATSNLSFTFLTLGRQF